MYDNPHSSTKLLNLINSVYWSPKVIAVLIADITTAMSVSAIVNVRLECAQVTLDQATLNQLLRTQTV